MVNCQSGGPKILSPRKWCMVIDVVLQQVFRQECLGGGSKRKGVLPQEKKKQSFQFKCLKWPILTEMTAKYGIYFYFLCQQGVDIPRCGAE